MPFDFLKRRKDDTPTEVTEASVAAPATTDDQSGRGVPFDGLTDEWRIQGEMHVDGRLSDALNRREAITISNVQWAPIDGSSPMSEAPGLKAVDPYDLIMVLAGESTLPPLTEAERVAHKIHKVAYEVALEIPPFRVVGTVYLFPGSEPDRLMDRATEMFIPVVDAVASLNGEPLADELDAILVNRFYLRGIEQIDRRTGQQHQKLPGAPMGGVSWQDRSS